MIRRVFLIVLDGVGVGGAPDAEAFGDLGAHTLRTVFREGELRIPNLEKLGLGLVPGAEFLSPPPKLLSSVGALVERSMGKDTTTGHWELAGLVSETAMPTFPNGLPKEMIAQFIRETGYGALCGLPYSGTQVIADYGEEHLRTGKPIVYTSADSVFQIAAHTDVIPLEELYRICRTARRMLVGKWGVGRVIARPFSGTAPNFQRTADRRDFSLEPTGQTLLDVLSRDGFDVLSVGKISDIFAARGITESSPDHGNRDCMARTAELAKRDFCGLCFVNLVDFDMQYGHRNDAQGFAAALNEFDAFLGEFLTLLGDTDALLITADHGCDPGDESTDHTRERVPLLVYGKQLAPRSFGVREGFATVAATVADLLGAEFKCLSESVFDGVFDKRRG